jgi:hypothetical protein
VWQETHYLGMHFSGDPAQAAMEAVNPRRETLMKMLVSLTVALGLAVAFAAPTFAADKMPTTKADCEKAKMHWDDATKTCSKSKM